LSDLLSPPSWSQRLFYAVIKVLVRQGSRIAFSEVEIRGMDRVPWDAPCIVSPNHQNAFLDALLIGAHAPGKMRYLSRSDIFGTVFDWVLKALQMVPVYRRRDGFEKLALNRKIFAAQRENLRQGNSLLIFSEAAHALTYYLRPLSKGSSRFAMEAQATLDRTVWLVPVGLNYYHHRRPGFKVSMVFGEPIRVADYLDELQTAGTSSPTVDPRRVNDLRDDLSEAMKTCLLIPEKTAQYDGQVRRVNRYNESFSFPELRQRLADGTKLPAAHLERPSLDLVGRIADVLNAPVAFLVAKMMRRVEDPVFALSLKFAAGILVLPIWWLLLFLAGWAVGGWIAGFALIIVAATTLMIRRALIRFCNPPHLLGEKGDEAVHARQGIG
jgi:1-acyl-sn-glycerol-3-phosphate acyltransferase